jgi:hypothetical protein
MKRLFLLLTLFCFTKSKAQTFNIKVYNQNASPTKNWDKTIGGSSYDFGNAIELTDDGGYIIAGQSQSSISGDKTTSNKGFADFWVVKLNANGAIQWDKTCGGSLGDIARAIVKCSNGDFLICGQSRSPQDGDKSQTAHLDFNNLNTFDYWVVRIDANGNKLWDKRFGWNGLEDIQKAIQTSDGGFLLGGNSNSNNGGEKTENVRGSYDGWLVKIDANGNKLWDKTLGGNQYEIVRDILELADGSFFVTFDCFTASTGGDITQAPKGGADVWLVKLNSTGYVQWDKRYGSTGDDRFPSIVKMNDGNYLIASTTENQQNGDALSTPKGYEDYWLLKIDPNGNRIWDKRLGGNGSDTFISIQKTVDGRFILIGSTLSSISGDVTENYRGSSNIWTVKVDENGSKLWDRRIGCDYIHTYHPTIIKATNDMGFVFVASSNSNISWDKSENSRGQEDFWVVKTGLSGTESPICGVPFYNHSLVANNCNGIVNWSNGQTGNAIHYSNLTESIEVSATCTYNNITSPPINFIFNVAWYQRFITLDVLTGNHKYLAITTLEASSKLLSNTNVKFQAGRAITLNPGFKAESGSVFRAIITGNCNE